MVTLKARMERHLARDWRHDLEPVWRDFFEGTNGPVLHDLPDLNVADLFPDRLGLNHVRAADDEVRERHMLRAFDGLTPQRVRVVVLGQDPYPRRNRATGRAFEDGAWNAARPALVADSLRNLLQSAASAEKPNLGISEVGGDWSRVRAAIQENRFLPPAVPRFFDDLSDQGVLSVNAAWTFTGEDKTEKDLHLKVWRPILNHLIRKLARSNQPIVFLILGEDARKTFCAADPVCQRTSKKQSILQAHQSTNARKRGSHRTQFKSN